MIPNFPPATEDAMFVRSVARPPLKHDLFSLGEESNSINLSNLQCKSQLLLFYYYMYFFLSPVGKNCFIFEDFR